MSVERLVRKHTIYYDDGRQQPDSCYLAHTCHTREDARSADENLTSHDKVGHHGSKHVRQVTQSAEPDFCHLKKACLSAAPRLMMG